MNDTSMLRVSNELKAKLKDKAKQQGRTLEWVANDALNQYLLSQIQQPSTQTNELAHFKPTDDWGA